MSEKRKVAKERRRSAELDVLIKKLYETYAMGKLEEKRFELLCAEYEKEQAELEQLVCQCCGEPFQSVRPNAKFCKPACREKFYRQEKRKAKEMETSQTA